MLSVELLAAVNSGDADRVSSLIADGADPFECAGPVDLYIPRQNWTIRIGSGCAAAQAIQHPNLLERMLPQRLDAFPKLARAHSVWWSLARKGEMVNLADLAVEVMAHQSLELLVSRLQLDRAPGRHALHALAWRCLRGCTHQSEHDGVFDALLLLLAAGADFRAKWPKARSRVIPGAVGIMGWQKTPLAIAVLNACFEGRKHALAALAAVLRLSGNANERLAGAGNMTMLHLACMCGDQDTVQVLLECGADHQATTWLDKTPSELAAAHGRPDIAAFIDSWVAWRTMKNSVDGFPAMLSLEPWTKGSSPVDSTTMP